LYISAEWMIACAVILLVLLIFIAMFVSDLRILRLVLTTGTFWAQVTVAAAGCTGFAFVCNFDFRICMVPLYMSIVVLSVCFDSAPPRVRIVFGLPCLLLLIFFTAGAVVILNLSRLPGELGVQSISLGYFGGMSQNPVLIQPIQLTTDAAICLLFFLLRGLHHMKHPHVMYVVNVEIENAPDEDFDPTQDWSHV